MKKIIVLNFTRHELSSKQISLLWNKDKDIESMMLLHEGDINAFDEQDIQEMVRMVAKARNLANAEKNDVEIIFHVVHSVLAGRIAASMANWFDHPFSFVAFENERRMDGGFETKRAYFWDIISDCFVYFREK